MSVTTPFHEQKREALLRRSDKLLSWIPRPEYSKYAGEKSITHLIALIDLVTWALERSLKPYNWRHFKVKFLEARNMVSDVSETAEAEKLHYYAALDMLKGTLQDYKNYVSTHDLIETYSD